jgi:hypothetical protein
MMGDEQAVLRSTLAEWRVPKEFVAYSEKKSDKVVYAF